MDPRVNDQIENQRLRKVYGPFFENWGQPVPPPHEYEPTGLYERRLCEYMCAYTDLYKGVDFREMKWGDMADPLFKAMREVMFEAFEDRLRKDREAEGFMREVIYTTADGKEITEYRGDMRTWSAPFQAPTILGTINPRPNDVWVPGKWVDGRQLANEKQAARGRQATG